MDVEVGCFSESRFEIRHVMDEKDIQPSTSDAGQALAVNERREKTVDLPQKCGLTSEPESDEEDDDDSNSM